MFWGDPITRGDPMPEIFKRVASAICKYRNMKGGGRVDQAPAPIAPHDGRSAVLGWNDRNGRAALPLSLARSCWLRSKQASKQERERERQRERERETDRQRERDRETQTAGCCQ